MRRVLFCVGLLMSVAGLTACGGGGGGDASSASGGGGGGAVTQSNISLPTSVQVVTSH